LLARPRASTSTTPAPFTLAVTVDGPLPTAAVARLSWPPGGARAALLLASSGRARASGGV
jgi:hypothetical protein